MTTTRIKDAPFTKEEIAHLTKMGIVEADWGHPQVTLDNPIQYFRDRVRLKDDPSLQITHGRRTLPRLRGNRERPNDRTLRLLAVAGPPKPV